MGKHAQTTVTTPAVQYGAEGSVLRSLPTSPSAAEGILKEAVWWIDAAHSSANQQIIENLGWGGSVLNTTCGSTQSVDSNDPKYLDWQGENYVWLPGVASNYMSVPDEAALNLTNSDCDIRVKCALDNWITGSVQLLVSNGSNAYAYRLEVGTSGGLVFRYTDTTSTLRSAWSSLPLPIANGQDIWVRAAHNLSAGTVDFYTSNDGVVWSQFGSQQTITVGTRVTNTDPTWIGCRLGNADLTTGKIYRAIVLGGINGTPVLDVDTSVVTSGSQTSFRARTGQTVTINRSTSGRKAVAVTNPLWLFGTDDYMEVQSRWLEHTGTNYVYLPNATGNSVSVPDAAALDITGNIDIRAYVALDDWTPSAQNYLVSKWSTGQLSYVLLINQSDGRPMLYWSTNGTSSIARTATVSPTVADGQALWIRATLDVDNDAGGHDVMFYTSTDGVTWTQLGSTVTTAGTTSIFSGTSTVFAGGGSFAGKLYRAQIYSGIDGTKVLDIDTSVVTESSTSFTAVTGQTVTINRSGLTYQTAPIVRSGYLVAGPTYTFRPSTYSLLDFGASDSFTVLVFARVWNTPLSYRRFIDKWNFGAGNGGWSVQSLDTTLGTFVILDDGPSNVITSGQAFTNGSLQAVGFVVNRQTGRITRVVQSEVDSVFIGALGSFSSDVFMRIGGYFYSGGGAYGDMEFFGAAVFRRALTAVEISEISRYYQERVK